MSLLEEMAARARKRDDMELAERQAAEDRAQEQVEKKAAKALAARLQPQTDFKMPPLPTPPAELGGLVARRAVLRKERDDITKNLRELETAFHDETESGEDALDQAAERLAAGEAKATSQSVLPEQISTMQSRLDLIQRAERKVVRKIASLNESHNRAIASALRPQHRRAVQRVHAALLELESANAEEAAVRGAIPGAPIQPCGFPGIGSRGPDGGMLRQWIAYVRRLGFLDEGDPEARFPTAAF